MPHRVLTWLPLTGLILFVALGLSRREQEVLTQIISGRTSRETADFYGIGLRTVEFHRVNVMAKLGATNTAELVAQARARGMI
jgi:DNA-binding CsgD family transcriptional regulator